MNEIVNYKVFIANVLVCILTISAAFSFRSAGRFLNGVDISYGVYIYHALLINILISLNIFSPIENMTITLVGTTILGLLSWYGVEKRLLRLKTKF